MNTIHSITTPGSKTSSRMLLGSILLMLALIGGLLFWTFYSSSDDREIRALLETRAKALNQKDLPLYLSCFSPNYRSGTKTYEDLQADASEWFSLFTTIQFSFQTLEIRVQDDHAIVENNYKFSVTDSNGNLIDIAKRELLEIRRENKGWKITKSLSIQ